MATEEVTHELLDAIERRLAAEPKNAKLLVQAIDVSLALGDMVTARKHADAALDAHPGDPFMRHRHANVLVAEGRLDEAAIIYAYLSAEHGDANIAYNLGLVRFRQGNYGAAIKAVMPFDSSTPGQSVGLVLRSLLQQGQVKEACGLADAQMARHERDPAFRAAAAMAYRQAGDEAKAKQLETGAPRGGEGAGGPL